MMIIKTIYKKMADMKISLKLMLSYTVVIAVCMLFLSGFFYFKTKNYMETQTTKALRQTLEQAKGGLDYKVDEYNTLANSVYVNSDLQDWLYIKYTYPDPLADPLKKILGYLLPLEKNYWDLSEMNLIISNQTIPGYGRKVMQQSDVEANEWYKQVVNTEDFLWWDDADTDTISVAKKLTHLAFGKDLGAVKLELNKRDFFSSIDRAGKNGMGWFDVIDNEGDFIYSGSMESSEEIKTSFRKAYIENFTNRYKDMADLSIKNRKYIALCVLMKYTEWRIVYTVPLDEYTREIANLKLAAFLFMLVSAMLCIIISAFLASRFTQRIRSLSNSMEKVQTGDFNANIPLSSNDEVGRLIVGFNTMTGKLKELVNEVFTTKVKEKESELKALQAQINPHFLYNTLNSISMLGMRNHQGEIVKISNYLARFYRLSLSKGGNVIRIRDEINQVKSYLDIQNISFENRIKVVYEAEEDILNLNAPRFILQPMIENSIVHGMWKLKKSITIRLIIKRENNLMVWKVIDDGAGIPRGRLESLAKQAESIEGGYGIYNVDQRIRLLFGDKYHVSVFSISGIGTVVTITTPADIN